MGAQTQTNYSRIAAAITYLKSNFKTQPGLDEIAEKIHLSPFHFQKLFTEWAGVSPKKFLQYLTVQYAKQMLQEQQATLFEAAYASGLSGPGRLHDLFVNLEGMTPGEYKNGGENLAINYSFADSPFGTVLVASTSKGICYLAFAEEEQAAFLKLQAKFPKASYQQLVDTAQQNALYIFNHDWSQLNQIKLHLKGTEFQLKVWEALLKIPHGQLTTYGKIAKKINLPNASRAVGTAIGDNPVAFLIPCHRIIQATGVIGGYHWGNIRKAAIIGWEAASNAVQEKA
ncbi:bifunctional helix-turn-helix domain-containing protein/methylated-DNA--[protein]-cysteine S-methyltransferase [Adhaeribacter pallidiroseus]|uniref:methylated-DNA--[protein]-cysteine S-methyltransferase n=1 Tax=Adhaeribacter pallidiroseus TaxID=2072847 RepID=A0A369QNC5_9BACT|nr:methylated-DNA--[protein]-cysteine S-methyltransferase [Adhaeribacter pallidiroseus]RDC66393.1 Methylated-DNA--[protein]-cysteine S-methyltransferase [Adhaeribacter pallidiroseus]